MSNNPYEDCWNEFRRITEFTYVQLSEAIFKKQVGEIKDAETQRMMMSKIMYTIDDLEKKFEIKRNNIITP